MGYVFDAKRYDGAQFRRCGRSGIVLPPVSLGLWQNFGGADVFETGRALRDELQDAPRWTPPPSR